MLVKNAVIVILHWNDTLRKFSNGWEGLLACCSSSSIVSMACYAENSGFTTSVPEIILNWYFFIQRWFLIDWRELGTILLIVEDNSISWDFITLGWSFVAEDQDPSYLRKTCLFRDSFLSMDILAWNWFYLESASLFSDSFPLTTENTTSNSKGYFLDVSNKWFYTFFLPVFPR